MKKQKRLMLAAVFLTVMYLGVFRVSAEESQPLEYYKKILNYTAEYPDFTEYQMEHQDCAYPEEIYVIGGGDFVNGEGELPPERLNEYAGREGSAAYTYDRGMIEYDVDIMESGMYQLAIEYFPADGSGTSIQRSFFIDGELPFRQMVKVEFFRVWTNFSDTWKMDNQGNDLKPAQTESPEWMESQLYDIDGYITEPLSVYLEKGQHRITIVSEREPMVIGSIIVGNTRNCLSYDKQLAEWTKKGVADTRDLTVEIQAESAWKKSSSMLYPIQDQSSPSVFPYSAKVLKNNTIGGNNWSHTGQWMEWEFQVEQDGFYNIALHAKQNFVKGIYVSRKITIDGETPFEEMNHYGFTYHDDWEMLKISDTEGNAYRFYLTAGKHTLRMQTVLGDFAPVISKVQRIVIKLNSVYRSIIRITGVAPDEYRDYQIRKRLPGLEKEINEIKVDLDDILESLDRLGVHGSEENAIITMRDQAEEILKDVEKIPKLIGAYKTNVSALGTWIMDVQAQPLQLDAIYICSPGQELPDTNDSFLAKLGHEFSKLFYSFIVDYNAIGNIAEEGQEASVITVWVGTGRDQANVIKALIDETFTPEHNIGVNVMLVDMGTLLQASLAGQGPDVALQVGSGSSNDMPVNYGLRNAAVDLTMFPDWEEVAGRFRDSAMRQYFYEGALYALPETENFEMMFYRKDILNELGIEVPETWDEVKVVISELSKNQMSFGMLPTEMIFTSLLYQYGGDLYNEDGTASALNTEEAISAFKAYCEFYTDYRLERATSVEQRFRTGESPIIIADYTTYNNLSVSAPDIKGLWGFTDLPGVLREDGSVDNTSASGGLACMMMQDARDKEAAWEFMKWWSSAQTQTAYGREMEGLMGEAARYPTANIEAFANLPWPADDFEALQLQLDSVKGFRQVPGSYFTWRNVNNAFYKVNADGDGRMQPREAMNEYIKYINAEITSKRLEFGLDIAVEQEEGK